MKKIIILSILLILSFSNMTYSETKTLSDKNDDLLNPSLDKSSEETEDEKESKAIIVEKVYPEASSHDKNLMDLSYEVKIKDFSTGKASIKLKMDNIKQRTIQIRSHGYHGFYTGVKDFKAYDKYGNEVERKFIKVYANSFGTEGYEWEVYANGKKEITLEYDVYKQNISSNNDYKGYIGNGFGLFTGEQLIGLFPSMTNYWNIDLQVRFDVPEGSEIVTPWYNKDGVYYPNRGFYIANKSSIQKEDNLMQSSIAIGGFKTLSKMVGDTDVRVALPSKWNQVKQEKIASNIYNQIAYYNELFGKSIGEYYMLAYSEKTHTSRPIWAGEWSLSQATSVTDNDYKMSMVSHQLFHRWNGWTWGWNSRTMFPLLMEGNNRYYETKSIISLSDKLNYMTSADANYLVRLYDEYLEKYNRKETILYTKADATKGDIYSWTAYNQGALICFALDMKLLEDTDGKVSLDDIMKELDDKYGRHKGSITYNDFLAIIKKHSGESYDSFFKDYVYGSKFLDLKDYFEDQDKDKMPNYYEIIRGTDPSVADSIIPKELFRLFSLSKSLIIGDRYTCENFHSTFAIGQNLTGMPRGSLMSDSNFIVLLDTGRYTYTGQLAPFAKLEKIEGEGISVKYVDGKLYVLIKAPSEEQVDEIIDKLDKDLLFVEGVTYFK